MCGAKPVGSAELGSLLCFSSVFSFFPPLFFFLLFRLAVFSSLFIFIYSFLSLYLFLSLSNFLSTFSCSFSVSISRLLPLFSIFLHGSPCVRPRNNSIRQPGPLMCSTLNIIIKELEEQEEEDFSLERAAPVPVASGTKVTLKARDFAPA